MGVGQTLLSPAVCQGGVRSRVKDSFTPFAVDKGNAFPPGGQTSAVTVFVMCSGGPFQCQAADSCIFRKGRNFCVYCVCTETYQFLNTNISQIQQPLLIPTNWWPCFPLADPYHDGFCDRTDAQVSLYDRLSSETALGSVSPFPQVWTCQQYRPWLVAPGRATTFKFFTFSLLAFSSFMSPHPHLTHMPFA